MWCYQARRGQVRRSVRAVSRGLGPVRHLRSVPLRQRLLRGGADEIRRSSTSRQDFSPVKRTCCPSTTGQ